MARQLRWGAAPSPQKPSAVVVAQQMEAASAPRTVDDLLEYTELHPAMKLDSISSLPAETKADILKKVKQLHAASRGSVAPVGGAALAGPELSGEDGVEALASASPSRLAFAGRALECPEALHVLHYDATTEFRLRRQRSPSAFGCPGLVTGSPALLLPAHVEAAQMWGGSSTLLLAYCVLQTWPYRSGRYAVIDSLDTVVGSFNLGHVMYCKAREAVNSNQWESEAAPSSSPSSSVSPRSAVPIPVFPRAPTNVYYWLKLEERVLGRGAFFNSYKALIDAAPSPRGKEARASSGSSSKESAVRGFRKFAVRELAWQPDVVHEYLRACGLLEGPQQIGPAGLGAVMAMKQKALAAKVAAKAAAAAAAGLGAKVGSPTALAAVPPQQAAQVPAALPQPQQMGASLAPQQAVPTAAPRAGALRVRACAVPPRPAALPQRPALPGSAALRPAAMRRLVF